MGFLHGNGAVRDREELDICARINKIVGNGNVMMTADQILYFFVTVVNLH